MVGGPCRRGLDWKPRGGVLQPRPSGALGYWVGFGMDEGKG